MRFSTIMTKIMTFFCHATILLVGLPLLFIWSMSEMISVELWRACAPARRNPNRNPSKGIVFGIKSAHRRRLSLPDTRVDTTPALPSTSGAPPRRSPGFFDLPYEIREQIWLDVLSPAGGIQVTNHPRVRKVTWHSPELEAGQVLPRYSLCKMLKLNRNFYREGIELLYTHNTFSFSSANVLTSFTRTTLPQRLSLIKHITLTVRYRTVLYAFSGYNASFMEDDWKVACAHLQRFTGLKTMLINLRFKGYASRLPVWDEFGQSKWPQRILGPLEPLRASEEFVVTYSWPESECSEWPKGKFKMVHEAV